MRRVMAWMLCTVFAPLLVTVFLYPQPAFGQIDPADVFTETFDLNPIRQVSRTVPSKVIVTYLSRVTLDCPKLGELTTTIGNCIPAIEVFIGTLPSEAGNAKGLKLSEKEPNSFLTQVVMILRPGHTSAEVESWKGHQMFRNTADDKGVLIEIVHQEAELGTVCLGPTKPLPLLDHDKGLFNPQEFKPIAGDPHRFIFVDTPRLPSESVSEKGTVVRSSKRRGHGGKGEGAPGRNGPASPPFRDVLLG